MKFYTKFQLPQNLFPNVRRIPAPYKIEEGVYNEDYNPAFTTIKSILALLNNAPNLNIPPEIESILDKNGEANNNYLYISLLAHCLILLPLTFLVALTGDLIDIATRPICIALNLALDIAQIAAEALTLALQLTAFTIEKVIVNPIAFIIKKAIINPIAFVWNKLFSSKVNKDDAGAEQEEEVQEEAAVIPPVVKQNRQEGYLEAKPTNAHQAKDDAEAPAPTTWSQRIFRW